jgi:hypothetical protein
MSERWEEAVAEQRERILERRGDRPVFDERSRVDGFAVVRDGATYPRAVQDRQALAVLVPSGRSCPIELWCDGHPTGAAVVVRKRAGGWFAEPHRKSTAHPTMVTVDPDWEDDVTPPDRVEVECAYSGCGAVIRRDLSTLQEGVIPALWEWHRRGRRSRARLAWRVTP